MAAVAARVQSYSAVRGSQPNGETQAGLRGRYVDAGGAALELVVGENELLLRTRGVAAAPVRAEDGALAVWRVGSDGLVSESLEFEPGQLQYRGRTWHRDAGPRPALVRAELEDVLGIYEAEGGDGTPLRLYLLEWEGSPHLQIENVFFARARLAADALELDANELGLRRLARSIAADGTPLLSAHGVTYRRTVGVRSGPTFRIEPVVPVADLRAAALAAAPPNEPAGLRDPDLVEVVDIEPGVRLDIRYATTNNFMSAVFYEEARAFLQRPAAVALAAAHQELAERGYGLLVHDAYRPWFATKMFWDATPVDLKHFVADPAAGSRHNRGAAVDLTLVDLVTGEPVEMTGGYDEFSERSYPFFPGGTDRQRWHRELLRQAMEQAGFTVYNYEWWHFDYGEWAQYPILDLTFDSLSNEP